MIVHIPTTVDPPGWMYDLGFIIYQVSGVAITDMAILVITLSLPAILFLLKGLK